MTLHHGDCLDVMPTLAAGSVDAIVTDPPYGLGFMGKEWDAAAGPGNSPMRRRPEHDAVNAGMSRQGGRQWAGLDGQRRQARDAREYGAWCEKWAAESLRVAKPGAYLLAFGGTRTVHRMTCAIEDAGWVIRDVLVWAYASGFPKSHNVGRDERFCSCEPSAEHDVRRVWKLDVPQAGNVGAGHREVLQPPLPELGLSPAIGRTGATAAGSGEPGLEGRRDPETAEGQLPGSAARPGTRVGVADGPSRRLHPGASVGDGRVDGAAPDAVGDGEPRRSQPVAQRARQPRPLADERGPQARGSWTRCARCGKPAIPAGLGSALKPAWEPIVLARKPLDGTLADNVERWGTGALNIDAARIAADYAAERGETWLRSGRQATPDDTWQGPGEKAAGSTVADRVSPLGRWPANVVLTDPIFDGTTPGVVGGGAASSGGSINGRPVTGYGGHWADSREFDGYGDTGTYSRFFLVPKADRAEREPVLGGLSGIGEGEFRTMGDFTSYDHGLIRRNTHPTVKPLDLMRHLVRLVTPTGGLVLDPFAGSGTTLLACELEGFPWVGIEREAEYVAIAEARLNGTQRGIGLPA